MAGCGTATFTDPDDYAASVGGARLYLHFTGGGDFRARLTWIDLSGLRILRCRERVPRIAFVGLAPGMVGVAFSTDATTSQLWGGKKLAADELVVLAPGGGIHQRTGGVSHWGLIVLAAKDLAAYFRALTGADVAASPTVTRIVRPAPGVAAGLRQLHAKACRLAEARPEIVAHREVVRAVEHELLHALTACLETGDCRAPMAAERRPAGIMARFETVLAGSRDRQVGARELGAEVGVSQRLLASCCAEHLGMSPRAYVRLRRLNRVRAALTRADPRTEGVAEIARRHGFSRLGRFTAAYRTAFGETPSITLRAGRARLFDSATAESA